MTPSKARCRRWIRPLSCLFLLTVLLCACGRPPREEEILPYPARQFTAAVRGELYGFAFAGELAHSPSPPKDTFVFQSPDALRGITVTWQEDEIRVSLHDMLIDDDRWDALLWTKIPLALTQQGEIISVESNRKRHEMTVIYQTPDGHAYTVILDTDTETPKWVESDGIWIEILSFT